MRLGISLAPLVLILVFLISGCGEEKETNAPAVKLTASPVVSGLTNGHGHSVEIPFSDLDLVANPSYTSTADFQYRSSDYGGHSHVIALSKQQVTDLVNGLIVTVTSTTDSTPAHSHTWTMQGGTVLYDKLCYNCHTNDKRNHNPMNVTISSGQRSAIISPSSATVSSATPAIPDPNFMPQPETSTNGAFLYGKYCAGCHNALATTTKANRTASQIKLAMGTFGLSDAQLEAIATALKTP